MKFNSVRFKVGKLFTLILGAILILYSGFLYISLYQYLHRDLDDDLMLKVKEIGTALETQLQGAGDGEMDFLAAVYRIMGAPNDALRPTMENGPYLGVDQQWLKRFDRLDLSQDYVQFADSAGKTLFRSDNISVQAAKRLDEDLDTSGTDEIMLKNLTLENKKFRYVQAPVYARGGRWYFVQIGTSETPILELLRYRETLFLYSVPLVLLLTSFVGRILADRILKPVNDITATAKNITYRDLKRRISTENVDEEMRQLVDSFNDMIARLERSFKHVEEFSYSVAHELKTPLAIIRGESELALRKNRGIDEYKRALEGNLNESRRMIKTIDDLLLLAKLDYQPDIYKFEEFDFSVFMTEIAEQSRILSLEKNIDVVYQLPASGLMVRADKLHLRRLFFNIIHNAIKFTPDRGRIAIEVRQAAAQIEATVSDTGIGIAEENVPKVFNKFFHIDKSGYETDPGNGLGLNIALSIAKAHGGAVTVKSKINEGSIFTVVLPIV